MLTFVIAYFTFKMKRFFLISLAFAICTISFAQTNWAVVNLSSNFMREEPDYPAELGNQVLMGTVVELLDTNSYWVKIKSPEPYTAWTTNMGLTPMTEQEKDDYIQAPKFICTAPFTHVFESPCGKSKYVCDLVMGDLVLKADKRVGCWTNVVIPNGKEGWVKTNDIQDFATWASTREVTGENVEALARLFMGVPYMWGGTSIKYVDCSGLARSVYFMLGVLLPRNASQQVKTGVEVTMEEARKGDLVFFGKNATANSPERVSHVGIYLGDGKIIHSSLVVRENSLIKGSGNYYGNNVLHFRRIIGHVDDGTGITSMLKSPFYFKQ